MILPENCQPGDLVAIFSTNGCTFRGLLTVREVLPGSISFNSPLPLGTTQGDILCLVRRGDQYTTMDVENLNNHILKNTTSSFDAIIQSLIHNFDLKSNELTTARIQLDQYERQVKELKIRVKELEKQVHGTPLLLGSGRRIKSSTNNSK